MVLFRRTFALALVAAFIPWPSMAQARLTAEEIRDLLTGNTIAGEWSGTAYRSFYSADGVTIYAPEDGPAERGRWRVDERTDQFESFWKHAGWTPYTIVRTDDGGYAWQQGDMLQPFSVLEGRQNPF